jgi:hypothetical protein
LDSIDHAFHTDNLELVQPDYLESITHERYCERIRTLLTQADGKYSIVPSEPADDNDLPWFCRKGLPSDHLPLEMAFKFQLHGAGDSTSYKS